MNDNVMVVWCGTTGSVSVPAYKISGARRGVPIEVTSEVADELVKGKWEIVTQTEEKENEKEGEE